MASSRPNRTGMYKISSRERSLEFALPPALRTARRVHRIVDSLRDQILRGEAGSFRIRCVLRDPREIYRLELELPEFGCQRMTLLDRTTLDALLACTEVRARLRLPAPIDR